MSKITLLTFEELVFPGIEQEVVVFIGEKGDSEKGIKIVELNNLEDLENLNIYENGFQKLNHVHEKWTKYFTTIQENQLISDLKSILWLKTAQMAENATAQVQMASQ